MTSIVRQNEKVVITANTDDEITGATSLTWVMAKRNKQLTRMITKTLGDGVVVTGSNQFKVTIDATDLDAIPAGVYQHQARVLDSATVPNVITFDDDLIEVKPTFTD